MRISALIRPAAFINAQCADPRAARTTSRNRKVRCLGSAEIDVVGDQQVLAAPDLIVHYVVDHSYQPPEQFVRAVEEATSSMPTQPWRVHLEAVVGGVYLRKNGARPN